MLLHVPHTVLPALSLVFQHGTVDLYVLASKSQFTTAQVKRAQRSGKLWAPIAAEKRASLKCE